MASQVVDARERFIGRGVYTLPEAARLVRSPTTKMRRWVFGGRGQKAILAHDYETIDGIEALSFFDLIEARFVRAFRERGVTFQHLRKVAAKARSELETEHPFASARFLTDGRRIILEEVHPSGQKRLIEYLVDQVTFEQFVRGTILSGVAFDARELAQNWRPDTDSAPAVIVDPRRAFGAPVIDRTGTPTEAIARSVAAEGSVQAAATIFELSPEEVSQAVVFERSLAA